MENAAKTLIRLIISSTKVFMYTVCRVNTTAPCCQEAGRQALLPQRPSPALPHSPWNTNLRPVCLVSLTISFRASSALSLVSFTKETGFCRPCFSSSSATLQTEPAFQSPAQLSSYCCSSRTLKALSIYALQMQTVPKNLLQYC